MKIKLLLILFICTIQLKKADAQEKWNFQLSFENNAIGPINSFLYFEQKQDRFTLNSTKNSDRRIYGTVLSALGRINGLMPKKGMILRLVDGNAISVSEGVDSLFGTLYSPLLGSKQFKGVKDETSISGVLYDGDKSFISLQGHPVDKNFTYNYVGLSARINDTTKKYIYNPELLEDKQWKERIRKMERFEKVAVDDLEVLLFSLSAFQNLPFSHFGLQLMPKDQADQLLQASHSNVLYKELDSKTALLEVKSFGGGKEEMDSVFTEVLKHGYKNLIVDLRENSGGGIEAGLAFGNHITDQELNVGYFVTNKWFSKKSQPHDFDLLPVSTVKTTSEFIDELKASEGKKLVCKPVGEQFKGNVYLLTSNKTASTCEPIVYALKTNNIATIFGENTAGAMLSATLLNVKDNFWVFMPIADYYTPDKIRLDKVGVAPNFVIPSDQALDYVLKMIEEKE